MLSRASSSWRSLRVGGQRLRALGVFSATLAGTGLGSVSGWSSRSALSEDAVSSTRGQARAASPHPSRRPGQVQAAAVVHRCVGVKVSLSVLVSIMASIPACPPGDRGSMPRRRGRGFFWSPAPPPVLVQQLAHTHRLSSPAFRVRRGVEPRGQEQPGSENLPEKRASERSCVGLGAWGAERSPVALVASQVCGAKGRSIQAGLELPALPQWGPPSQANGPRSAGGRAVSKGTLPAVASIPANTVG